MRFNIFDDLYQRNDTNPSLLDRLVETFGVFSGDLIYFDYDKKEQRLGLVDYLTFGTIALFSRLFFRILTGPFLGGSSAVMFVFLICPGVVVASALALKAIVAGLLTLCVLPFVTFYHFTIGKLADKLIISLLNKEARGEVDKAIAKAAIYRWSSIYVSAITLNRPGISDYLIETLNNNPSIKRLSLGFTNCSTLSQLAMEKLVQNLKHIESLEAQSYTPKRRDFDAFAKSKIKHIEVQDGDVKTKDLLSFIEQNTGLEKLYFNISCGYDSINVKKLKTQYQNLMETKGILHGCTFGGFGNDFSSINSIAPEINAAIPTIKSAFEFFRLMILNDHGLNSDVIGYILKLLFSTRDIIEQNKKGYARLINSNGFFSPITALADSKDQVQEIPETIEHPPESSFASI